MSEHALIRREIPNLYSVIGGSGSLQFRTELLHDPLRTEIERACRNFNAKKRDEFVVTWNGRTTFHDIEGNRRNFWPYQGKSPSNKGKGVI